MRKRTLFIILILIGIAAILAYIYANRNGERPAYRLARVERGPIISTVSSTGTLTPVTTVQVGSQVSGQIKKLYADFNSEVHEGQVIAQIDPENFEARVRQADAELAVALANVAIQRAAMKRARAELDNAYAALAAAKAQTEKARAVLVHAKRDLDRKKALHRQAIISKSQIDDTVAAHDQALAQFNATEAQEQAQASIVISHKAQVKMAQAQVEHALAQVKQREAALHNCKVDLDHTVIRSPLAGVVIQRTVDIGQTVAASLQAPTLFTIAQDLKKMQVDTNVDEADIGRIVVGQRVHFTVDAFPGREFSGQVEQIRKAPQSIQNVVTYTVVVSAENQDQKLLPGMTANVQVVIDERQEVLKVPNAALRYKPLGTEARKAEGVSSVDRGAVASGERGQQGERLERLIETLGLNEDQQAQVRAIFAEQRERIMRLRAQGAPSEDIRAEWERMREESTKAVSAILNPEQREKLRKAAIYRAANPLARGHVWVLDKGGTPMPVDLITGISDGSFTEIVRGNLEAGQEIITGESGQNRKISGSSRRVFGL
jgi:HlyD family secretion protein